MNGTLWWLQAVALGDLMVMDPLQAGLLRALAGRHAKAQQLQDQSDPDVAG